MAYVYYNPNPDNKFVGDCAVRAISSVTGMEWEDTYFELCIWGAMLHDMPNANSVLSEYLKSKGFSKHIVPDTCPWCYTVNDFIRDNPIGRYILGTGTHVIGVIDGNYYDTSDSGNEVPIYYWKKESK